MKPVDHALDRLFRAAARPPAPDVESFPEEPVVMPARLQSRILAAHREWLGRRGSEEFLAMLSLIRRGLAVSALVAVGTALICHRLEEATTALPVESMMTRSVAELSLLPDNPNP
jgi:hypothetical protein